MLYIREEDESIFEEVLKLTGETFSGAVAKAVRQFVDQKKSENTGLSEVEIRTGFDSMDEHFGPTTVKAIRFIGRLITIYTEENESDPSHIKWRVFLSRKGKIVVERIDYEYLVGTSYIYFILDKLPEDGVLVNRHLGEKEFENRDNGTKVRKISMPRLLLVEVKNKLGEAFSDFMDI